MTVYHPSTPGANAHATVGLLGFVGTFTGQSAAQMGVSEIGVSFPDATYFGTESFEGIPFVYLLRDVLYWDRSVNQTVARMQAANRTCDLLLGAGDGKPGATERFRGFAYSASELFVFDDTNLQPYNATPDTWHPRFDSIVYWGMDWDCPGYNRALAAQLGYAYGTLTPEVILHNITSVVQTGDVHAAVYDLTEQQMFVTFMARTNDTVATPQMAYDRQWTQLDLNALFALPPPSA